MTRLIVRWLLGLALFAPMALAQAQAADAQFPLGSRIGLAPPAGMDLSTKFSGFEDAKNDVFIRIVAMPGEAYSSSEKQSNDALKKQGMTVEKREPIALADGKGLLLVVRQEASGVRFHKWMLIAPLADVTALVSFEIRDEVRKLYPEPAIRSALASTVARVVPTDEQLRLVPFHVTNLAGMRVVRVLPGAAVQLTDGPKGTFDATDQPHVIISISPGGPDDPRDRESFARLMFDGLPPLKDIQMAGSEPMRVNGQPGYETRAEGKDANGNPVELVQWLRFGNGAYMRILAFGPKENWTQTFARFRAVRDGIAP
jgi:hypothetical protein